MICTEIYEKNLTLLCLGTPLINNLNDTSNNDVIIKFTMLVFFSQEINNCAHCQYKYQGQEGYKSKEKIWKKKITEKKEKVRKTQSWATKTSPVIIFSLDARKSGKN